MWRSPSEPEVEQIALDLELPDCGNGHTSTLVAYQRYIKGLSFSDL